MLRFFPYESFYIKSKLEPDVVQAKLQLEITFNDPDFDKNADRFFDHDTHFLGFAGKRRFNIKPYVDYNDFLLPKIQGTIENKAGGGSIVNVKMALAQTTVIVVTICLVVVMAACAVVTALAISFISEKGMSEYLRSFNPITLIPFFVLVLTYVLATGAFKQESKKARNILLQMFEGEYCAKVDE